MSLTLHFHPLSSFCQKVLIAFYENDTPFTPNLINLMDEAEANALKTLWPIGKFPVLVDDADDRTIPESSIIIEYLDRHYAGTTAFLPADPDLARQTRMADRFYDLYVNMAMQKVVTDRLRPDGQNDTLGVDQARTQLATALGMVEQDMAAKTWAMGDQFTMADCAAAPGLFYADMVLPLAGTYPNAAAYLDRLKARPSYARVLKEAEPYLELVPR